MDLRIRGGIALGFVGMAWKRTAEQHSSLKTDLRNPPSPLVPGQRIPGDVFPSCENPTVVLSDLSVLSLYLSILYPYLSISTSISAIHIYLLYPYLGLSSSKSISLSLRRKPVQISIQVGQCSDTWTPEIPNNPVQAVPATQNDVENFTIGNEVGEVGNDPKIEVFSIL